MEVGDPRNPADQFEGGSVGAVSYNYKITPRYVSVWQYVSFLNSVARFGDPYHLYKDSFGEPLITHPALIKKGISKKDGSFLYIAVPGSENIPMVGLSFTTGERMINWLANGEPQKPEGVGVTETGSYDLTLPLGDGRRYLPAANARLRFPTEDELHKAAFYAGGKDGFYESLPWEYGAQDWSDYNRYHYYYDMFSNPPFQFHEKTFFFEGPYGVHELGRPGYGVYITVIPGSVNFQLGSSYRWSIHDGKKKVDACFPEHTLGGVFPQKGGEALLLPALTEVERQEASWHYDPHRTYTDIEQTTIPLSFKELDEEEDWDGEDGVLLVVEAAVPLSTSSPIMLQDIRAEASAQKATEARAAGDKEAADVWEKSAEAWRKSYEAGTRGDQEEGQKWVDVAASWGMLSFVPGAGYSYEKAREARVAGREEESQVWRKSAEAWKKRAAALEQGNQEEAQKWRDIGLSWGGAPNYPGAGYSYGKAAEARAAGEEEAAQVWEKSAEASKKIAVALEQGNQEEAQKWRDIGLSWGGWENYPGAGYSYGKAAEARAAGEEEAAQVWEKIAQAATQKAKVLENKANLLREGKNKDAERQQTLASDWGDAIDHYRKALTAQSNNDSTSMNLEIDRAKLYEISNVQPVEDQEKQEINQSIEEDSKKKEEAEKKEQSLLKEGKTAEARWQMIIADSWNDGATHYQEALKSKECGRVMLTKHEKELAKFSEERAVTFETMYPTVISKAESHAQEAHEREEAARNNGEALIAQIWDDVFWSWGGDEAHFGVLYANDQMVKADELAAKIWSQVVLFSEERAEAYEDQVYFLEKGKNKEAQDSRKIGDAFEDVITHLQFALQAYARGDSKVMKEQQDLALGFELRAKNFQDQFVATSKNSS